jgi:hypothetical protein
MGLRVRRITDLPVEDPFFPPSTNICEFGSDLRRLMVATGVVSIIVLLHLGFLHIANRFLDANCHTVRPPCIFAR